MAEPIIRVLTRIDGTTLDYDEPLKLSDFGGIMPGIGDLIIDPKPGYEPPKIFTVVQRVFNWKGKNDHVGLIVDKREPTDHDAAFFELNRKSEV